MKNNNIWLDFVVFQILLYLHILQIHHSPPHIEYADDGEQQTDTAASSSGGQSESDKWIQENIYNPLGALVDDSTMPDALTAVATFFIEGEVDLPFLVKSSDDARWKAYKSNDAESRYVEALCNKFPTVHEIYKSAFLQRQQEKIDGDMTEICRSIWDKLVAEPDVKKPDAETDEAGGSRPHP